jgi:hypothetical protein
MRRAGLTPPLEPAELAVEESAADESTDGEAEGNSAW